MIGLKKARKGGCYIRKFVSTNVNHQGKELDLNDPNCKHRKMFYALITDGEIQGFIRVYGAKKMAKQVWKVVLYDGSTLKLEDEAKLPKRVYGARFVQYEKVLGVISTCSRDFDAVKRQISTGSWHLDWKDDDGRCHRSSTLVKIWKDKKGEHHGITDTGAHYIF